MRNANTWVRSVLGLGAVLLVAGPGLVMAVVPANYTPRSLVVNGPANLTAAAGPNHTGTYTATVTFTNGQTLTSPDVPVVFTAQNGNITVSGNVATGVTPGISAVRGTYSNNGAGVTGTRIVRVQ